MQFSNTSTCNYVVCKIYNQLKDYPGWTSFEFELLLTSKLELVSSSNTQIIIDYPLFRYDEILIFNGNQHSVFEIQDYTLDGNSNIVIDISSLGWTDAPTHVFILTKSKPLLIHDTYTLGSQTYIRIVEEYNSDFYCAKHDKLILYNNVDGYHKLEIDDFEKELLDDNHILYKFNITSLSMTNNADIAYLIYSKFHMSTSSKENKSNVSDISLIVNKNDSTNNTIITEFKKCDKLLLDNISNAEYVDTNKKLNIELQGVEYYDIKYGQVWKTYPIKGTYPSPRFGHTLTKSSNIAYLFGGYDYNTYFNDTYILYLDEYKFTKIKTFGDLPSGRYYHKCALVNDNLYVIGGKNNINVFNDLYILNTINKIWSKVNINDADNISKRYSFGLCAVGNFIYLLGGTDGTNYYNELYRLDTSTNTWTKLKELNETIYGNELVFYNNKLYSFGGYINNSLSNDLIEIDLNTLDYKIYTDSDYSSQNNPCKRVYHSLDIYGNNLILFGGLDENNKSLNDLFILDLESKTWYKKNDNKIGYHSCSLIFNDNEGILYTYGGTSTNKLEDLLIGLLYITNLIECTEYSFKFYLNEDLSEIPDYITVFAHDCRGLKVNEINYDNANDLMTIRTYPSVYSLSDTKRSFQFRYDFSDNLEHEIFTDSKAHIVYKEEED